MRKFFKFEFILIYSFILIFVLSNIYINKFSEKYFISDGYQHSSLYQEDAISYFKVSDKITHDLSEGKKIYNYFGDGIVPYNVVIDRNMRLIYSSSGFNKDEIVDAIKTGLKTSIKNELPLKKNKLSLPSKTGYKKLRENKGFD